MKYESLEKFSQYNIVRRETKSRRLPVNKFKVNMCIGQLVPDMMMAVVAGRKVVVVVDRKVVEEQVDRMMAVGSCLMVTQHLVVQSDTQC